MKNELGYGDTVAMCDDCNKPLQKAPARWDGEPTFVSYLLACASYGCGCPLHPHSKVRYEQLGILRNTMPQLFEHICTLLKED